MLKPLLVLDIFTFLSWIFDYVENRFDEKAKVNFKFCEDAGWTTNNHNTHITNILKSKGNHSIKFGQL